jgi:hypothetical protein
VFLLRIPFFTPDVLGLIICTAAHLVSQSSHDCNSSYFWRDMRNSSARPLIARGTYVNLGDNINNKLNIFAPAKQLCTEGI